MNLNQMMAAVSKMFPNANLGGVVQKAQEAMQGTPDTLSGVSSVAHRMGIDQKAINSIFQKYGNTMQARMLCSMMGTTPEALKKDAESIVSGGNGNYTPSPQNTSKRFPRLK